MSGEKQAHLEERFAGSLLGSFCGDALGMAVEGRTRQEIQRDYGEIVDMIEARLGRGTYTDDTEMTIGVAESLLRRRGFDGLDMARGFVENFNEDRGYALGSIRVIQMLRGGDAWDKASQTLFGGTGSYGNGSAMRVAPVGLLYHDNPERLTQVARQQSMITHFHELGQEGASLQAHAVGMAVRLAGKSFSPAGFVEALMNHVGVHGRPLRAKLMTAVHLLGENPTPEQVVDKLGAGVTAIESVVTAIYCFARNASSFERAVVYAVNLGGDTDTIGAMTGAIAGAYHGVSKIPARWLDALENGGKGRDYVHDLARRLAAFATGQPEGAPGHCPNCGE